MAAPIAPPAEQSKIESASSTAAPSEPATLLPQQLLTSWNPPTPPGPETVTYAAALANALQDPDANTPGANDWTCHPSESHPRPVVLAHGTWENRYYNWARLAPALQRAGYCVYALNYGDTDDNLIGLHPTFKGTGDLRISAKELALFVDQVLASTGASQVDIVGHSQGVLVARQYLKFEGGATPPTPALNKVRTLVSLGGDNHGTTVFGIGTAARKLGIADLTAPILGVSFAQQIVGSEFLAALNEGGDTVPGVDYVVIATKFDEIVTPWKSSFMTAGPGATVRNITLQDGCGIDLSDHLSMSYSRRTIGHVLQSLDSSAPPPPCEAHLPLL